MDVLISSNIRFPLVRQPPYMIVIDQYHLQLYQEVHSLGAQLVQSTLVYLGDVIVFSADFATHLRHLEEIFWVM